jgi:hypothetical protein
VIGLPLFQKNAVEMSKQMMGQAKKYLGSSVIQYELGNEVRRLVLTTGHINCTPLHSCCGKLWLGEDCCGVMARG